MIWNCIPQKDLFDLRNLFYSDLIFSGWIQFCPRRGAR